MLINIQSVMLIALGFLSAALIALVILPAYRRRVERLATVRLRQSIPLTEAEIRADKDRLRAEYAIRLHELSTKLEQAGLNAARQKVELNRRDASISALEIERTRLATAIEEHENARRVLEHTVTDRLPKVEQRLVESKRMLLQRDREIGALTLSAERQSNALNEATQINARQRDELNQLNATLSTRASRRLAAAAGKRDSTEIALRSEVEALRAKLRDQAALVTRLQALLAERSRASPASDPSPTGPLLEQAADGTVAPVEAQAEVARLTRKLAEAEAALAAARVGQAPLSAGQAAALQATARDQVAEIARLSAALDAYRSAEAGDKARDEQGRVALEAEVASLRAESGERARIIETLRAELAGANDQLARQAAHFRDELVRLGAGTTPASPEPRRTAEAKSRRPLSERIAEPRVPREEEVVAAESGAEAASARGSFLKALDGGATDRGSAAPALNGEGAKHAEPAEGAPRRPRLMDRITGLDKTSA
jgi:hypothetical protein